LEEREDFEETGFAYARFASEHDEVLGVYG
jgi:hypothetical protein